MSTPASSDARLFYRCAFQRYEEAKYLLDGGYTTGAVYLAGYGIECVLKALILTVTTSRKRPDLIKSFTGGKAHDFDWLRSIYLSRAGSRFPAIINQYLTFVAGWSTDLRYMPRQFQPKDAQAFLKAVTAVMHWADERI